MTNKTLVFITGCAMLFVVRKRGKEEMSVYTNLGGALIYYLDVKGILWASS